MLSDGAAEGGPHPAAGRGGKVPTVLCCKEAAAGANLCLQELLLAKALMVGPCLSCSPTALLSCPTQP